ncbi:MAG: hypothetical protein J6Q68_01285 [Clostridia bacterium]|nr:hypothetical protein [Clostridia bacterium]
MAFAIAFVCLETILFILIQCSGGLRERVFSFSSVAVAALFALVFTIKRKESVFTSVALLFTVCADVCLVLMAEQQRLLAMIFFSAVQTFYFLRILLENDGKRLKATHISVRVSTVLFALFLTLIVLGENADALSLISMIYFASLIVNIVFAFFNFKKSPLLALGLVFFSLCDVLVGLSLIDMYIPIAVDSIIYKLTHTEFNLIWTFYVPSQTLIALSNLFLIKNKAE